MAQLTREKLAFEPRLGRDTADQGSRRTRTARPWVPVALVTVALSGLFGLPHLLIPGLLGPDQPYTPFAVTHVSALTYDESTTYAAQLNYTLRRNAPPYDTDVFEDKDVPAPVPTVPYFVLGAVGRLLGGVAQVFIAADFLLPPLAFVLLYLLIVDITGRRWLASFGALTTVLVPFGPRNFFEVPLKLALGAGASVIQPLEMSRLLQPELSFTLFTAALLLLWRTLRTRGTVPAVAAGVLGGLLFYTYVFYWPAWVATSALLLGAAVLVDRSAVRTLAILNLATWLTSVPFWRSYFEALRYPNMAIAIERHLTESGHDLSLEKVVYTLVCIAGLAGLSYVFVRRRWPLAKQVLLFHWAVLGGGIAGLNMEVLTGVNVEALAHFSNRLFQPFFVVAATTLVGPALLASRFARPRLVAAVCSTFLVGLLVLAGMRQVLVSINVAPYQAYPEEQRLLFTWLEANTAADDVVLTSDPVITYLVPVYTHNFVYVPYAERSTIDFEAIERRYLIAMKLLQHPAEDVYAELARDAHHAEPPLGLTASYHLFLRVDNRVDRRLSDAHLERVVSSYGALELPAELGRWRLDYVYARGTERPAEVAGWSIDEVYATPYGSLWRVRPSQASLTGGV